MVSTRKKVQSNEEVIAGCGCAAIIILFAVAAWAAILYLAAQIAIYFGYPGWLGIAVYIVASCLLGGVARNARRK